MNLTDIVIVGSIITGLLTIPFLVTNSFGDYISAGKTILGVNESDVTKIPARTSKMLSADRFERTYETAFGKFRFIMAPDNIFQELSRPGTNVQVITTSSQGIWKLTTHNYMLKITEDPDRTIEEFSSADGSIIRLKEKGGINETFEGFNPDILLAQMEIARTLLNDEVAKMETIKLQTIIPELGVNQSNPIQPPQPPSQYHINITSINYTEEWVEIVNYGSSSVNMENWTLSDTGNHIFTFPDFTLAPSNSVRVYSGNAYSSCTPSETVLCWTSSQIWNNGGDTATLKDNLGNTVSTYTYP